MVTHDFNQIDAFLQKSWFKDGRIAATKAVETFTRLVKPLSSISEKRWIKEGNTWEKDHQNKLHEISALYIPLFHPGYISFFISFKGVSPYLLGIAVFIGVITIAW